METTARLRFLQWTFFPYKSADFRIFFFIRLRSPFQLKTMAFSFIEREILHIYCLMLLAATQAKMLWEQPPHCRFRSDREDEFPSCPLSHKASSSSLVRLLDLFDNFPLPSFLSLRAFPSRTFRELKNSLPFIIEKEQPFSFKGRSCAACITFRNPGS